MNFLTGILITSLSILVSASPVSATESPRPIETGSIPEKTTPNVKSEAPSTATQTESSGAAEIMNRVTCTKGSDSREIEIVAKDGSHTVNYTKAGVMKEVGNCMSTKAKCRETFDKLKANLVKSGFDCKT